MIHIHILDSMLNPKHNHNVLLLRVKSIITHSVYPLDFLINSHPDTIYFLRMLAQPYIRRVYIIQCCISIIYQDRCYYCIPELAENVLWSKTVYNCKVINKMEALNYTVVASLCCYLYYSSSTEAGITCLLSQSQLHRIESHFFCILFKFNTILYTRSLYSFSNKMIKGVV
jgi:hypothetical protein